MPRTLIMLASALALAACGARPAASIGDATRGRALFDAVGCGACHTTPEIDGARGAVGPPLAGVGGRALIASSLANTPENMARWISSPQQVSPGNAMPDTNLTPQDARDITAYLYSL